MNRLIIAGAPTPEAFDRVDLVRVRLPGRTYVHLASINNTGFTECGHVGAEPITPARPYRLCGRCEASALRGQAAAGPQPRPILRPDPPDAEQVLRLRLKVQAKRGLAIGEAQAFCGSLVGITKTHWRRWESGARAMHPGLWELAVLKSDQAEPCTDLRTPGRNDVRRARKLYQSVQGVGAVAAVAWCAESVMSTPRSWAEWESEGDKGRAMPAGLWALFLLRLMRVGIDL